MIENILLQKITGSATRKRPLLIIPIVVHYIIVFLGTWMPYYKNTEHIPMAFNSNAYSWFQWDSLWYINIAHRGYDSETATAFFPFVPTLVRWVHNEYITLIITGIAFWICLYLLREFFQRMLLNEEQITMAIWLFALNPCAFYYTTIYTEVWAVLFVLASLHMAVKGKWLLAFLFAALLTTTRATTVLFGIFPLVLFFYSLKKQDWKLVLRSVLWGMSTLIGILSYMVLLYVQFKDPFIFSTTQKVNWAHYYVWPWIQMVEGFFGTLFADIRDGRQGLWTSSMLFVYFGLVSIWKIRMTISWERLGVILFTISNVLLAFSFDTRGVAFYSTFRYLSIMFPIYGVMAMLLSKKMQWVLLIFFAILAFIGTWTFTHHNWYA